MSDEQERALIGGGTPRYLTADLPGIGGAIKEQVSDFIVEELPLYTPLGKGEHTFFEIEKKGISTFQAVRTIARGLGVAPKRISYAGLKDAQAITCQVLSVDQVPPEAVTALDLDQIRILWAERHQKKLKIGHLRGNRFTIRIRGVAEEMLPAGQAIVDLLVRRGVPNWYGPQRFGQRGDSALLGKYVVDRDARAFVERLLGGPHPNESERVQEARARFDAGQWAEALAIFPHNMANERRALHRLIDTEGDAGRAYASVPKRFKIFLLSAYQSALFNRVLDARLETLDRVFVGDLAMKHPGRSVFRVEDEAAEQPRADRFEISPTGPLFGYKMIEARGRQGQLEDEILAGEGLSPESWRVGGGIKARGQRRALRFPVHEPELSFDEGVVLKFSLPRGCYATALLAEVMKVPLTSQVPEM
ncbi:MAG: tRNA pseudouridine(13) synthase TruD [Anaerolineae bacterium]